MTKVQFKEDASKLELEKSLLLAEHSTKFKESADKLVALMKETGVTVDFNEDSGDLGELISACKTAFQNYQENKSALQRLIDEREEIAREKEELEF